VDAIKKLASTHWQYEIAMELKISQSSVSKWALAHGIKTRTRKEAIRRHLNERC
jgi:predicted transcriptional regulator